MLTLKSVKSSSSLLLDLRRSNKLKKCHAQSFVVELCLFLPSRARSFVVITSVVATSQRNASGWSRIRVTSLSLRQAMGREEVHYGRTWVCMSRAGARILTIGSPTNHHDLNSFGKGGAGAPRLNNFSRLATAASNANNCTALEWVRGLPVPSLRGSGR
jgi:hypothetical protein